MDINFLSNSGNELSINICFSISRYLSGSGINLLQCWLTKLHESSPSALPYNLNKNQFRDLIFYSFDVLVCQVNKIKGW